MAGTSIFLLIVLIYSLIPFPVALSDNDDQLSFICLKTTNKFNADFKQSRVYVLAGLVANAPKSKGFNSTTQVENKTPAYGVAQCRGGLSQPGCVSCLNQAALDLATTHCPKSESAIIWRIHCMLKYSNVDFRGKLDDMNRSSNDLSVKDKYSNETALNQLIFSLYTDLAASAASFRYGVWTVPWNGAEKLHGLAQCNGDLSPEDCISCIGTAISYLFHKYRTFSGAIAAYGSCTVRFGTADFMK